MFTAWTPAHSEPATLTYQIPVTDEMLRRGLGDPAVPRLQLESDLEIEPDDHEAMQRLQARLESGERFAVAGPPRRASDGTVSVPVAGLD